MTTGSVLVQRNRWRWQVTLNRPGKANALSRTMLHELHDALLQAGEDTDLRALVITGAGERVFSGGADLAELSPGSDDALWAGVTEALSALEALTVASVNGACIGGALTLALACDIRVCVNDTNFAYPALANGVLPGVSESARMRALIGPGCSAMLLLGGVSIDAPTALQWGLVERVVERAELGATVDALVQGASVADKAHLARMKRRCRGDQA